MLKKFQAWLEKFFIVLTWEKTDSLASMMSWSVNSPELAQAADRSNTSNVSNEFGSLQSHEQVYQSISRFY
jgi:hypothetical protein